MKAAKNIQLLALLQNSIEPKTTKKQSFFSFGSFMQNILKTKTAGKDNLNSGLIRFGNTLPKASTNIVKNKQNVKADMKPARITITSFKEFAHLLGSSATLPVAKQVKPLANGFEPKKKQTDNEQVQFSMENKAEAIKDTLIQGLFLSQQEDTTPGQWKILNQAVPGLSFKTDKKPGGNVLSVNVADHGQLKMVRKLLSKIETKAGQRHISIPKIKISVSHRTTEVNRIGTDPKGNFDAGTITSGKSAGEKIESKNSSKKPVSGRNSTTTKKNMQVPHQKPETISVPRSSQNMDVTPKPNTAKVKNVGGKNNRGPVRNIKQFNESEQKDILSRTKSKETDANPTLKAAGATTVKQATQAIHPDTLPAPISKTRKKTEPVSVKNPAKLKDNSLSKQELKSQPAVAKPAKSTPTFTAHSEAERAHSATDKHATRAGSADQKTQNPKVLFTTTPVKESKAKAVSGKTKGIIPSAKTSPAEKISQSIKGEQIAEPSVRESSQKRSSAKAVSQNVKPEAHKDNPQMVKNSKQMPVKESLRPSVQSGKTIKPKSGAVRQTEAVPLKTVAEKISAERNPAGNAAESASSPKARMESVREQPVSTQQVRKQVENGKIKVSKRSETLRFKPEIQESKPVAEKLTAKPTAPEPTKEHTPGKRNFSENSESANKKIDFAEPKIIKNDSKHTMSSTLNQPENQATSVKIPTVPLKFQPLVTRLQEMMAKFNSARKSAKTNTTFRIENSPAGKMEIRFEEKAGHKQIKVLVESEATRHELQKAVPQLQQNLNAKGVELISFTVQVGQFGNKAGQAAPHNKQGMRHKNKETKEVRHEADKSTVMKRNYGYNTIEVIA